ncbi:MAG: hypothetical protein RL326_1936 [Pseudomonadota bacterium]|jgi:hypothetical protein
MITTANDPSICRVLAIFDGETEDLVDVIELVNFDLQTFTSQFDVPIETDPQMLDRYAVGPIDVDFLLQHLPADLDFNFTTHAYFLDAAKRE